MKKLFILIAVALISSAAQASDYPLDKKEQRLQKRQPAYGTVIGEAVKGDTQQVICNYKPGCKKESMEKTQVSGVEYKAASQYPKQGYVLDTDGTYKFKPGKQSK